MNKNVCDKSKLSENWIVQTILFDIIVLILFFLIRWNILAGFLIMLLLICTIFVGWVLQAYVKRQKEKESFIGITLSEKQKKDSQSLLRYATAVLAFLSLVTTAQGMNSFVFTKSWLGYLGSFAVQSILAVFSLLLCRFYVQITILPWKIYIKRIVSGLLTLFFVIALIISSAFSYTYIANNAYAYTWNNDSEYIIQKYLTSTIYKIQEKNDNTGEELLNNIISSANEKLRPIMEIVYEDEARNTKDKFKNKLKGITGINYKKNGVNINLRNLYSSNTANNKMLDKLKEIYNNNFKQEYIKSVTVYNKIMNEVTKWKNNYENIINNYDKIQKNLSEIENQKKVLNNLKRNIKTWKSYQFQKDLSLFRSKFKLAVGNLITGYESLRKDLKNLKNLVEKIDDTSKSTAQKKLDSILSNIYLLGTDNNITLESIIVDITTQAGILAKNDGFSSEEISNFMDLKNNLEKYKDYLDLSGKLDEFRNDRANHIYEITDKNSMSFWIKSRDEDFKILFSYLRTFGNQEEIKKALDIGTGYQRDLLGKLTDFEKAFNYFKYEFPLMACFSLFVAVFFDLGAFFTGCFLYCTDFFTSGNELEKI